jgi:hypothetical protein
MTQDRAEAIERAIAQIGEAHWSNRNVALTQHSCHQPQSHPVWL